MNVAYRIEVRTRTADWRPIGYRPTYATAADFAERFWSHRTRQLTGVRLIDQHREEVGAEPVVYSVETPRRSTPTR